VLDQLYDIVATIPPGTNQRQFNLMMQNLIADRFHVTLHHEWKEFPGYELIIDPGGLKLKESSPEDIAFDQYSPGRQSFSKDGEGIAHLARPGFVSLMQPGSNGRPRTMLAVGRAQPIHSCWSS